MFCVQCEQTMKTPVGNGCAYAQGMCGKTAEVSDLQDLLLRSLQALSVYANRARQQGIIDQDIDTFTARAFFSTLTNVNFDGDRIISYAQQAQTFRNELKQRYLAACTAAGKAPEAETEASEFTLGNTEEELKAQFAAAAVNRGKTDDNQDVMGARLLAIYGLKGAAAYMEHAHVLGQYDEGICGEFHQIMDWLSEDSEDLNELLACSMQIGKLNYRVMEMLDRGETTRFGHPVPTAVNVNPVKGKAILVSGHDLHDLEKLLQQTEGAGINVYTHGEMLPAHGYPELKKYAHLAGNYGTAWQNQQTEFAQFPGAIVMTSNCIIDPNVGQYADRIFTSNIVGWPGVTHIADGDFTPVIEKAQSLSGFEHDQIEHMITVGFARNALMEASGAVVENIKAGNIKHFFLIGGCDGSAKEREYFTDLATQVPEDSVVLTLGCGKFRFNKQEFGDINGIPRLIDIGQCNDSYSAIQLAIALSEVFECDINELPLSLMLSWFEQKAIVILLTLLSLGVKNIHTGPTLPAFLTENLANILIEQFDLKGITTAEQDLAVALNAA